MCSSLSNSTQMQYLSETAELIVLTLIDLKVKFSLIVSKIDIIFVLCVYNARLQRVDPITMPMERD